MIPFIGSVLDKVLPRVLKDQDKVFQAKAETEKAISSQEFEIKKSIIQEASANIRAEAQGESWLQQSWRPIAMLWVLGMMSVYMLCLLYDPVKYEKMAELLPFTSLTTLITIGLTGYVVGRSGEKIMKTYKGEQVIQPKIGTTRVETREVPVERVVYKEHPEHKSPTSAEDNDFS